MKLTIGHTHDADDAFMFYAMLNGRVPNPGLEIHDTIEPISVLNEKADDAFYDMTAVSAAFLPRIADRYDLLTVGACMAEDRGPVMVSRPGVELNNIAVPGIHTTACYAARCYLRDALYIEFPYDKILAAVRDGEFDGGVIITEEQTLLTDSGFEVVDLGAWWQEQFKLPLPLGVDVIRKSLPEETKRMMCGYFQASIRYALEHETEALEYALKFGRGIDPEKGLDFVKTFVNRYTVSLDDKGIESIRFFMAKCKQFGLINEIPEISFIHPHILS